MKLQILLSIVCLTLRIDSQSLKPTRTYNGYEPGSAQLYFEDNLPRNTKDPNLSTDEGQSNLSQTQRQLANDSYVRAHQQMQQDHRNGGKLDDRFKVSNPPASQSSNIHFNQYPTFQQQQNNLQNLHNYLNQANPNQYSQNPILNPNSNYQYQQNLEILPPLRTSQDYYSTNKPILTQTEIDIDDRYKTQAQVPVVPLSLDAKTTQDLTLASAVISHIGIFMMKSVRGNQSNAVVSPISVVNMLAMLQAGSTGVTQKQVSDVLSLTPDQSAAVFQLINTEFQKRGNQRNVLRSASSIFAADAFELNRAFKNFVIQKFGSEVSRISFENPNVAAQKINSWIASKTNDQIDKLVSPDSIGINTQLVLANAIYFKGLWETLFKPQATSQQDFHLSNGKTKSVPFMTLRSGFRAGLDQDNKAIVVVLPFENKQYSLVMILPTPGADVTGVLAGLNGEALRDYQNLRRQDVLLEIPKFTVRSNTDLEPLFAKMGITKMFSPTSELGNIGLYRASSPQLSSAVHSAMLSVDERGATAAASTVVAVVALSYDNPSVVFRADRPFLAVLWDNQLNLPLFMTKIEDPSQ